MNAMQQDTDILYLGTDTTNHIWYWRSAFVKPKLMTSLDQAAEASAEADLVRVLGFRRNLPLLAALYSCPYDNNAVRYRTQVGSPAICSSAAVASSPFSVVRKMRQLELPGSVGGYRYIRSSDVAVWNISAAVDTGAISYIAPLTKLHPCWPAASFISSTDGGAYRLGRLLVEISDPRWYVDHTMPERRSKLYSYLGLTDANMKHLLTRDTKVESPAGRNVARAEMVFDWWYNSRPTEESTAPRAFLHHTYNKFGTGARGALRVSQHVVDFLRAVWLDSVAHTSDGMFVPKYFFRQKEFVDEYTEYAESLRKNV